MKIKQRIYLMALVLVMLSPLSCKKFLQQTDTSNVAADALFKKPEDAIQLVNALFREYYTLAQFAADASFKFFFCN